MQKQIIEIKFHRFYGEDSKPNRKFGSKSAFHYWVTAQGLRLFTTSDGSQQVTTITGAKIAEVIKPQ